jgi:hypothetical protein
MVTTWKLSIAHRQFCGKRTQVRDQCFADRLQQDILSPINRRTWYCHKMKCKASAAHGIPAIWGKTRKNPSDAEVISWFLSPSHYFLLSNFFLHSCLSLSGLKTFQTWIQHKNQASTGCTSAFESLPYTAKRLGYLPIGSLTVCSDKIVSKTKHESTQRMTGKTWDQISRDYTIAALWKVL